MNSCFPAVAIEEPILSWGDDDGIDASDNIADNSPGSQENASPHTPIQHQTQTPSVGSSNSKTKSANRRSTSFPRQTNTLMSWVTPSPRQPSLNASTANMQRSPTELHHYIELLAPPSLDASVPLSTTYRPHLDPLPTTPTASSERPISAASNTPAERTAYKLAKQLRNFQGCSHEQHQEADQLHHQHHQRQDVHSKCSSMQEVTSILRGTHGTVPLPDVLSSAKLMKPMDLGGVDCQAVFEGTSPLSAPEDAATRDENLPRNLVEWLVSLSQNPTLVIQWYA